MEKGRIRVEYISTGEPMGDALTKPNSHGLL